MVLGENLTAVDILMQDWFSSWTIKTNLSFCMRRGNNLLISSIIVIRGKTMLSEDDNAMCYASYVLSSIYVCNVLRQNIGQFSYMLNIPFWDMALSELLASAFSKLVKSLFPHSIINLL